MSEEARWSRFRRLFRPEYGLFGAALLLALTFFRHGSISGYGEGQVYLLYAQLLFNPDIPWYLSIRDPGYPLVIFLSGALHADSLRPLLLVQALMGWLTIVMAYAVLADVSRKLALAGGWLLLLSLIPFQFQNVIFNDQAYGFFFTLLCFTAWRALTRSGPLALYDLALAIGWLMLMRMTLWVTIPVALFILARGVRRLERRRLRHGICLLLVLGLFGGLNHYLRYGQFTQHPASPVAGQLGLQLLYNFFRFNPQVPGSFAPQDGPATELLNRRLLTLFKSQPGIASWLGLPGQTAEENLRAFFRMPHYTTFRMMYENFVAADPSRRLDIALAREQLLAHPEFVAIMLKQAVLENGFAYYRFSIGADIPDEPYIRGFPPIYRIVFMPLYALPETREVANVAGEGMRREIEESLARFAEDPPWKAPWHGYYAEWFAGFVSLSAILTYGGWLAWLALALRERGAARRADMRAFALLNLLYWPAALTVSMLSHSNYRYHVETASWLIVLGCLGAWLAWRAISPPAPSPARTRAAPGSIARNPPAV